jgi:hypothetical protein
MMTMTMIGTKIEENQHLKCKKRCTRKQTLENTIQEEEKTLIFAQSSKPLEFELQVLGWCAHDSVDLLDLVEFVGAGKEGEQGDNFEEDAADTPEVHLVVVEAVSQQALGRAVPEQRRRRRLG